MNYIYTFSYLPFTLLYLQQAYNLIWWEWLSWVISAATSPTHTPTTKIAKVCNEYFVAPMERVKKLFDIQIFI